MARAASDEPYLLGFWMAVDDEVIVGGLLVLADARFNQRRVFHSGKAERHVFAGKPQAFGVDGAFAGGRIKIGAAGIVGDFEASTLIARNAIHEASAMIAPDGEMAIVEAPVAPRRAEEKDVLPGRSNLLTDGAGKQLPHPRTAGEDVATGGEFGAIRQA